MSPPSLEKKNNGCLMVVLVVMGLCLFGAVAIGFGVYRFSQTEEGKTAFGVMAESVRLATEGREGPGVDALEAAGCSEAMVMDMSRLVKLLGEDTAEALEPDDEAAPWTVITCQTRSETLDCDEVWAAFAGAVQNRSGSYVVQVQHMKLMMAGEERCQAAWAADGTPLDMEEASESIGGQFER